MARIPYFDRADLPPEHQDLLNRPINLFRALVNSPGAARGWSEIGHYIRHGSKLDPRLRELAILQVAMSPDRPTSIPITSRSATISASATMTSAPSPPRPRRTTDLEPLAKTVLKAAREMSTELAISDATFAHLREKLDTEHVTDLVLTIAFYCAVVRVLATLQIDVEDEYLPYLKQFRCRPPRIDWRLATAARAAPQAERPIKRHSPRLP